MLRNNITSALFLDVNVEYMGARNEGTVEIAPPDGNCFYHSVVGSINDTHGR
jgi:hypothetical protein